MENKYGGMTVNERLYVSGLWDEFEQYLEEKNIEKIISVLNKVELTGDNVTAILKNHGLEA
jgi:hypothetical protein